MAYDFKGTEDGLVVVAITDHDSGKVLGSLAVHVKKGQKIDWGIDGAIEERP